MTVGSGTTLVNKLLGIRKFFRDPGSQDPINIPSLHISKVCILVCYHNGYGVGLGKCVIGFHLLAILLSCLFFHLVPVSGTMMMCISEKEYITLAVS